MQDSDILWSRLGGGGVISTVYGVGHWVSPILLARETRRWNRPVEISLPYMHMAAW